MAKKSSKKELTKWACEEGCDVSLKPCKHLEKKLGMLTTYPFPVDRYLYDQNVLNPRVDTLEYERSANRVEKIVRALGIEEDLAELFVDVYIDGMSYRQVMSYRGYHSTHTIHRLLNKVRDRLKKLGPDVVRKLVR